MSQPVTAAMEPDEFLAWERVQLGERHHYIRGEVFAMSGGSARHSFLGAQMIRLLGHALLGTSCNAYTSDLRLGLASDVFVYADAVVVCHPMTFRPGTKDVVTNPSVVVEVLSKSTEAYDRGDKLAGYLALASVEHVVFVAQRQARVEIYTRHDDGTFRFEIHQSGGSFSLPGIEVTLDVDAIDAGAECDAVQPWHRLGSEHQRAAASRTAHVLPVRIVFDAPERSDGFDRICRLLLRSRRPKRDAKRGRTKAGPVCLYQRIPIAEPGKTAIVRAPKKSPA
jgi:Uma2 family endonuclease